MPSLLVIAPSADLRRSLSFAFEAEGYEVTAVTRLSDPRPAPGEVDCSILDNHAADEAVNDASAFCIDYAPVVLLANYAPHPLSGAAFRTVQKPQLGPTLSFAVRVAVSSRANPT